MHELTEKQAETLQGLMRRALWWVEDGEVRARVGDLKHGVREVSGEVSPSLVGEAVTILNRWLKNRLGELIRTGGIERWPGIRLVDGMPVHIDGVDGVPPHQIPSRSA